MIGIGDFATIEDLAASTKLTDGEYYTAFSAFNGEPETFLYDADSALTADGALVVDATGMGAGRLVSTRTVLADFAELDADVRELAAGATLNVAGNRIEVVASEEDYTTTGGLKVKVKWHVTGYALEAFGNPTLAATWNRAMAAANGLPLNVGASVPVSGAISYAGKVDLRGNGHEIDMTAATLVLDGGTSNLPNLASDIALHSNTVEFVSPHGLSEGDVFYVWHVDDGSWSNHRPSYHDGDWMRVAEVTSTTVVEIYGHAPDAYPAAKMLCGTMDGQGVTIRDLCVIPPASGEYFTVSNHQGVRLSGLCAPAGNGNRNFYISRCYDVMVEDTKSTALLGNAYPFTIGNTKNYRITGGATYSNRHVFSLGGADGQGAVPTRNGIITGYLATCFDSGVGAIEAHGNCDNTKYVSCIVDSCANFGGRNVSATDCKIIGRTLFSDGNAVFSGEVVGGLYQFTSCEFETVGDGTDFGIVQFQLYKFDDVYNTPSQVVGLSEPWRLRMNGCTIRNLSDSSSSMRCVNIGLGNSADGAIDKYAVDVNINGLIVDAPGMLYVLGFTGTNDFSAEITASIDNNLVAPSGALVAFTNAVNAGGQFRLPRQTIVDPVSYTTAESSVINTAKTLKWSYPRRPFATVGLQRLDGVAFNPGTTALAHAYIYAVETTSLRMGVKATTGGNFTIAQTDAQLVGQVWMADF